jgi:hypothetical protein
MKSISSLGSPKGVAKARRNQEPMTVGMDLRTNTAVTVCCGATGKN